MRSSLIKTAGPFRRDKTDDAIKSKDWDSPEFSRDAGVDTTSAVKEENSRKTFEFVTLIPYKDWKDYREDLKCKL